MRSSSTKAFSFTRKPEVSDKTDSPGPGAYSAYSKSSSMTYLFAKSERLKVRTLEGPGPGEYEPKLGKSGG